MVLASKTNIFQGDKVRVLTIRSRSRKVKCDEIKPHCLRCFQSRIRCEGYQPKRTPPRNLDIKVLDTGLQIDSPSQPEAGATAFEAYLDTALLSHIGLSSLLDSDDTLCHAGQKAWKHLLERYANASSCAQAACTLYGAAKELQIHSPNLLFHLRDIYQQHYGSAVSLLRTDVEYLATRLPSALVTCMLLCSVELLFRRRQNALKHIDAVFRMIPAEYNFLSPPISHQHPTLCALALHPEISSDLHLLLRIIDIQILSYSGGTRLASMEPCPLDDLQRYVLSRNYDDVRIESVLIHIIHASYAFIANAAHGIAAETSTEMFVRDRDRLLVILQHGISLLDSVLLRSPIHPQQLSLKVLRNFCLALSGLLAHLFGKYETNWTLESSKFQDIIVSAEELLASIDTQSRSACGHRDIKFVPQLGIIPPLWLAAFKYRNSAWRARAIHCLRQAGLEGPWNGAMSAAMAQRCMEIEESTPDRIPSEQSMVSLCFALENNGENDGRLWPSSAYGSTTVKMLRRARPVVLVHVLLPSSAHFNKDLSAGIAQSLDPQVWEHWQERIDFNMAGY